MSSDNRTAGAAAGAEPESARLYRHVADDLLGAIETGVYPVGSSLPTEVELGEAYGVSRYTVREALRRLVELGLIERRQGAGTRVLASAPPVAYVHTIRALSELFSYTRETTLVIAGSETIRLSESEAHEVRAPQGSRWVRAMGTRWTADRAETICHVTLYIHSRFGAVLKDLSIQNGPVYALIEARSGERVAEALQEISAGRMTSEAAAVTGAKRGAPGLRIVRRYLDESGGPMLVAVNWHVAETFTYSMRLKRDGLP